MLAEVVDARRVIEKVALRTPLVRLNGVSGPSEIYLKLENLQPIGSFKIRGAANAIARLPTEQLERGVVTASAGNMRSRHTEHQVFSLPSRCLRRCHDISRKESDR